MCDCPPGTMPQEYTNQVALDLPPHCVEHIIAKQGFVRNRTVGIDRCLVGEIQLLWALGIVTTASCCGHNLVPPSILVIGSDAPRMRALGYIPFEPRDPDHPDGWFIPQSV